MAEEYISKVTEIDGVLCYHKCGVIVRCKDCKHFVETGGTRGICCLFQGMTNPRNDDFCSEGERKEAEH